MSNEQPIYFAAPDKSIYRVLIITGAVCAAIIALAFVITAPIIERNKATSIEHAIHAVLPAAHRSIVYALTDTDHFSPITHTGNETNEHVFVGYDKSGKFVGFAMEAQSRGYQDTIRLLYAYAPERDAIIGLVVLENRETPGLGDRIVKDSAFARNFAALDVRLANDGQQLLNPIQVVRHGTKSAPSQIDAITGATVSSRAVGTALSNSANFWIPRLKAHAKEFADGAIDGK